MESLRATPALPLMPPESGDTATLLKGLRLLEASTGPLVQRPRTTPGGSLTGTTSAWLSGSLGESISFPSTARPLTSTASVLTSERRLGTPSLSARATVSRFGHRANERALEALNDFRTDEEPSADARDRSRGNVAGDHNFAAVQRTYDKLVEGIGLALEGSVEAVKKVGCGEHGGESVPAHGMRHYSVNLPNKPTSVSVCLVRQDGLQPQLYGSTHTVRPSAKEHEFRGHIVEGVGNKLVYDHALMKPSDVEELGTVDRRTAVPPYRTLYFTVEAQAENCAYKLQVRMAHIAITLSRQELRAQVQAMKHTWEQQYAEVSKDPLAREQFDHRVCVLKKEKRAKIKAQQGHRNYARENRDLVREQSPERRHHDLQLKVLKTHARVEAAAERREAMEGEMESRRLLWLSRGEDRRRVREETERKRRAREQLLILQKAWLTRLALFSFSERCGRDFTSLREVNRDIQRKLGSTLVLRKVLIRALCWRRRRSLYANVIRFRVALATYARHMQPCVQNLTQPVIKDFLERHTYHRDSPNLVATLKRFRNTVIKVQGWWRQYKMRREQYFMVFYPLWEEIQIRLCADLTLAHQQAHLADGSPTHRSRANTSARRSTTFTEGSLLASSSPRQRRASQLAALPETSAECGAGSSRRHHHHHHFEVVGPPRAVVFEFVMAMLKEMRNTYKDRLRRWNEDQKSAQWSADLRAFGVQEGGEATAEKARKRGRPHVIYIDEEELEVKVQAGIEAWNQPGSYAHLKLRRRCIMRPFLQLWYRYRKRGEGEDAPGALRTRRSIHVQQGSRRFSMRPSLMGSNSGSGGESPLGAMSPRLAKLRRSSTASIAFAE
eukprot:TRINITY_DN47463_c0_g1_i1.p1 TRINITY_DN47463_c0_g1~~TRINITY_DN47463_c0_g1_i1.p1  ORF type:complete len:839 (-),score=161.79 TRINITY_DN47463_c0_g1_i1:49-2565(-)